MAAAFPSGMNTFVPSFDATGQLIVGYSRKPKDFPLNEYVTLIPVKRSTGYYLKLTPENAARILSGNVADFVWHDGNDAPSGEWNTESHEFVQYFTTRYAFPFRLGYKAVQQADWKILAVHAANVAQQAMTGRTLNVVTKLTTAANWPSAHTSATATALGVGGDLGAGTGADPRIKKAINKMAQQILKATLGVVRPRDLKLVMSPVLADRLGRSQEMHDYVKSSPFALAQIRGDSPSQNGVWGLPDQIYGVPVVVEDAVRVTSRKGATLTSGFIFPDNGLLMVARPGQLVMEGGRAFSTAVLFMFEEMTVESKDDPDNRRNQGRVVEDYAAELASTISGYYLQDATS